MSHPHGYETTSRFLNEVAYVNLNSWVAPESDAIYLELYPTALFNDERAAATFSPDAARKLAAALKELADVYEQHREECLA